MTQTMDRRKFLVLAAGGAALGALVILQGCSSGSDNGNPAPMPEPEPPTFSDERGSVSDNHGHSVTLTAAQQEAGQDVTLTLSSGTVPGPHTHTVSLSAADVAAVAAGTRVDQETSFDLGHSHNIRFN